MFDREIQPGRLQYLSVHLLEFIKSSEVSVSNFGTCRKNLIACLGRKSIYLVSDYNGTVDIPVENLEDMDFRQ